MRQPNNEQGKSPTIRAIDPHLPRGVMLKLTSFIDTKLEERIVSLPKALRALCEHWKTEEWALDLRATALLVADLVEQGWRVDTSGGRIHLAPPGIKGAEETVGEAKARLRTSLQLGRERQLANPSVNRFIDRFSRPALN